MFHHLHADEREKSLREVRRVLAPGGSFHLLDFVQTKASAHGGWSRLFHSSDNRILALMQQAGFVDAKKVRDGALLFGLLHSAYYKAFAPQPAARAAEYMCYHIDFIWDRGKSRKRVMPGLRHWSYAIRGKIHLSLSRIHEQLNTGSNLEHDNE
jgi:SAM-dependent methyltransferase